MDIKEEEKEVQPIVEVNPLDERVQEVIDEAVATSDPNKTKDLIELFNDSINKKAMIRTAKLNNLLDAATDQAIKRFEEKPDQFSNKEVLDYMNTVTVINEKAMNSLNRVVEAPAIQVNQQNTEVNLNLGENNLEGLDQASRMKVLNAINSILRGVKEEDTPEVVDAEVEVKDE